MENSGEVVEKLLIANCPSCGVSYVKRAVDSSGEHECSDIPSEGLQEGET